MKFVIEIEDFYLEDGELEKQLKDNIISSCVHKIIKTIEQKIEDGINKEVKAQVEQTLYRKIGTFVTECIQNDKIKGRYSSDANLTLQEYVKLQFTETASEKAPTDNIIRTLASSFGDEMKKRYDLLFASQLVAKMKDSGFLKEETVALLLEKPHN